MVFEGFTVEGIATRGATIHAFRKMMGFYCLSPDTFHLAPNRPVHAMRITPFGRWRRIRSKL